MRFVVFAAVLALATPALAQSKSTLEQALSKPGATVVKVVHPIDSVDPSEGPGSATLSALSLSNPKDAAWKPKGIAIAVDDASDRADSITNAFVDQDELDGLIGGLDWMLKSMGEWEGKEDREQTDAVYSTKGGFSAGFSYSEGKSAAFAQAGKSRIRLDKDGLATLRAYFVLGREYLKTGK
jgi:hypothetical protein